MASGRSPPNGLWEERRRLSRTVILAVIVAAVLAIGAIAGLTVLSTTHTSEYTEHSPISITGNGEFAKASGVLSGSGTTSGPYLIEGWDINATGSVGVKIQDTTAQFVVGWCFVHSGGTLEGIILGNCTNGMLVNNTCSNDFIGIGIYSSSNNTLKDNSCSTDSGGIHLWSSPPYAGSDNNNCSSNNNGLLSDGAFSGNAVTRRDLTDRPSDL